MLRYPPRNKPGTAGPSTPQQREGPSLPGPGASQGPPPLTGSPVISPASTGVEFPVAPAPELARPAEAPVAGVDAAAWWNSRWPNSAWGNWIGRPRPTPPAPPPCGPSPGNPPPFAPGASYPPVPLCELAAAYVPFQVYTTIYGPGELPAPGTIFPDLLRVPPLYRWPPGTDGRC